MTSLNDIRENMRMQEKLPRWLVGQWAEIIAFHKNVISFPSFEVFVDFVSVAGDPSVIATTEKKSKDTKTTRQKRQSFAASSNAEASKPAEGQLIRNSARTKARCEEMTVCFMQRRA